MTEYMHHKGGLYPGRACHLRGSSQLIAGDARKSAGPPLGRDLARESARSAHSARGAPGACAHMHDYCVCTKVRL